MKQPGQKPNRSAEQTWLLLRRAAGLCLALALAAVFCGGFVVERFGGQHGIPTWSSLSAALGLESGLETAPGGEAVRVILLDVGQGDAALIEQGGEYCLIDAGAADSEDALLRQLRQAGVQQLDLLVMTHPHADHIGGMQAVLQEFPVELLLLPDLQMAEFESVTLEKILAEAEAQQVPAVQAETGDTYPVGGGTLTVLMAGCVPPESSGDDPVNDTSLCLRYEYGAFTFLDTGDAEAGAEQLLAASGVPLRATVFKAGHHGSSTSNTEALLALVQPQAVGISCGLNNSYGHPHAAALERLEAASGQVWRTDLNGAALFEMQDGLLTVTATAAEEVLLPAA